MIRRFIGSDYNSLISIWEASVSATHKFLSQEDFLAIKDELPSYFANVDLYVYKRDGKDIAFIGVSGEKLEMLFCMPEFFGQGVGKALLEYAIQFLGINLVDVNADNKKGLKFYKSFGFQVIGKQPTDSAGRNYPIVNLSLTAS